MHGYRMMFVSMIALILWCGSSYASGIIKEYPQFTATTSIVFQGDTLWIGTGENGIARLDTNTGSFRYYDMRDGILARETGCSAVDKTGIVWVGTPSGLNCYRNGIWESYTYLADELVHSVKSICVDTMNNIWVTGTNHNLSISVSKIFKYDGISWIKVGEFSEMAIEEMVATLDGSLWCYQGNRNLLRYKNGEWTSYPQIPYDGSSLCADTQGNLWFQGFSDTNYGTSYLFKYDMTSFTKYPIPHDKNGQTHILYDIVATDRGLWCSTYEGLAFFDGARWHGPSEDFYEGRYSWDLAKDSSGKIWVTTGGRGIYVIDGNDPITGVSEKTPSPDFILRTSPNPFNASTVISYTLPEKSTVRLGVFNVTGQRVCDLASGTQTAGEHRVTWNAEGKASGLYFARLETEHATKVEKLLLLR